MSACCRHAIAKSKFQPRRHVADVVTGALSLGAWAILPKCPVCLAAYIGALTGLGLSIAVATYVQWMLYILFVTVLGGAIVRRRARTWSMRRWH